MDRTIRRSGRLAATGRPLLTGLLLLALAGCAARTPAPEIYVLEGPASGRAAAESLTGRPVLEVAPVQLPDYLDTTDLLRRRTDHRLILSRTGRWGERLSIGVTRSLAGALGRDLPGLLVTGRAPDRAPDCRVLVDVAGFERTDDGPVVLDARWRVVDGRTRAIHAGQQVALSEAVSAPATMTPTGRAARAEDAALVAAMSKLVRELAGRIADGVKRDGGACRD